MEKPLQKPPADTPRTATPGTRGGQMTENKPRSLPAVLTPAALLFLGTPGMLPPQDLCIHSCKEQSFPQMEAASCDRTFRIQQWDTRRHDFLESAPGLGMFVTVTTYNDEVLLSKLYGPQGTFYFTSHSPGEHIICLESNSTRLVSFGGSKLRIHLEIRVGQHDLDAAAAQAKDKVNEVSFKLERLIEQIEQIVKEQNYQRDREENFRTTSEDTNGNVLRWAFAQTLIFIATGIFQMKHLKDFFIAKKLV
ncbi:transmembrane emp24 domain-containing protein 11-like [Prionailurus viverrinus]|uniref:transmembrane emp24 domain-containing protein 11-like n=1 Tax=Prionailurus viverrinus TaxID=61388 RepID=UPI001FF1C3F4|nr:transmembrane emp24 domain-containing protein 11-like [Prionailurus viverrinus]